MCLPLLIVLETQLHKIFQDFFGGCVPVDTPGGVKQMHVGSVERLSHLEVFEKILPRVPKDFKVNILGGAVVCVARNHLLFYQTVQVFLVILSPATWWKFCNLDSRTSISVHTLCN